MIDERAARLRRILAKLGAKAAGERACGYQRYAEEIERLGRGFLEELELHAGGDATARSPEAAAKANPDGFWTQFGARTVESTETPDLPANRSHAWAWRLAGALDRLFATEHLVWEKSSALQFVGTRSGTKRAKYLYVTGVRNVCAAADAIAAASRARVPRDSVLEGIGQGFAQRVFERVLALQAAESTRASSTALALRNELALVAHDYVENARQASGCAAPPRGPGVNPVHVQRGRALGDTFDVEARAVESDPE